MLLNRLLCHGDAIVALPVLDHFHALQCLYDVLHGDAAQLTQLFDALRSRPTILHQLEQCMRPIAAITQPSKITQRFFRRSNDSLTLRQLVAECNQEFAVSFALVWWQNENARDIVTFRRNFFLAEIADNILAILVDLAQHVEDEGLNVVVERLVIEKQFCHKTECLAVQLVILAINFEY